MISKDVLALTRGEARAARGWALHLKRTTTTATCPRTIERVTSPGVDNADVLVIGGGPAGVVAALRAARLGARTALVTRDGLGGMAAVDGPVPVRTLAHAARLIREARQLPRYGIAAAEPALDYSALLARVREVTGEVQAHSLLRDDLLEAGVTIHEHAGAARFTSPYAIVTEQTRRPLEAEKIIICTGGLSRRLDVPGFHLTSTHSDAWALSSAPVSMLVIGAGATGVQVASIFNAFGSRVTLFEAGPRILMGEDDDVAAAVAAALRGSGVRVLEAAGAIERFEACPAGVGMVCRQAEPRRIEASIAVAAVGWVADTTGLALDAAGVQIDRRGYVRVDPELRTTAPHIFAAGDVTGHVMVVHEAVREGYLAATNVVLGSASSLPAEVSPLGSFTDPEYASVGLTENEARKTRDDVIVAAEPFSSLPRPIIDGRPAGFCKLIADRRAGTILGCHIVGERAVELAQLAAVAMAARMTVGQLALVPFSFPTYANALARTAVRAARELELSNQAVTSLSRAEVNGDPPP